MKRLALLFSALSLLAANAAPPSTSDPLEARTAKRAKETPLIITEKKPNEIKAGRLTFNGIAVQIVKTDNPLQLINPAAPAEYGWAEQSVVWKQGENKVSGLKIFSIVF